MDEAGYRVGVRWLYVGERWADFANTVRLGSYDVVNLRAARQLNRNTDVFVTVENLLDEDYGMWQAYPAPGRRVRGGVQHRF
jgi:outer membrane cobalamin receptor